MASTFLVGFPNRIDDATITGGSWLAGAPVTNVGTWALAETARSSNALAASTKIRINHGAAVTARALVLMRHNLSSAATVQWKRGTTAGASDVADSGAVDAWRFTPRSLDGEVYDVQVVQASQTSAQYDEIEIVDTANAAGYVEIGRVFVGPVFAPTYNPQYGLIDSHEDLSIIGKAHSGAQWPAPTRRLRKVQFELVALSLTEGDALHEMEQIEGLTGEVVYLPFIDAPAKMQRYGMVGLLNELNGIQYPRYSTRARGFSVRQRA